MISVFPLTNTSSLVLLLLSTLTADVIFSSAMLTFPRLGIVCRQGCYIFLESISVLPINCYRLNERGLLNQYQLIISFTVVLWQNHDNRTIPFSNDSFRGKTSIAPVWISPEFTIKKKSLHTVCFIMGHWSYVLSFDWNKCSKTVFFYFVLFVCFFLIFLFWFFLKREIRFFKTECQTSLI